MPMPRSVRLDAPGVLHHVVGRVIERKEMFFRWVVVEAHSSLSWIAVREIGFSGPVRWQRTNRARREKFRVTRNTGTTVGTKKIPSSNRLHALKGDREGQYSISINDPWRICFRFVDGDAYDVEITDYH
jgi:RelE-like toxin of type II toxin-antitoxin system HigB